MNKSAFELVKLQFQIYTENVLHYNFAFFGQIFLFDRFIAEIA